MIFQNPGYFLEIFYLFCKNQKFLKVLFLTNLIHKLPQYQKNLYLNAIKWSRYGNISKAKWQVKRSLDSYTGSWSDETPEEEEDDEG